MSTAAPAITTHGHPRRDSTKRSTSNLRVSEFTPLPTPQELIAELPLDARVADVQVVLFVPRISNRKWPVS